MFLKWTFKSKRSNGAIIEMCHGQIVEVDDETDAVFGMNYGANNLDMKYELFCKWLQQNGQHQIVNSDRNINTNTNTLLTEDEVSSFANSEDSGSDVFLDTESNFPVIILSNDDNEIVSLDLDDDHRQNGMESPLDEFRVDTPASQLSVSDFDCSSSDITVGSKISGTSSQMAKRKAKHNKGRAPPVPTHKIDGSRNSESTILNEMPPVLQSAHETDI